MIIVVTDALQALLPGEKCTQVTLLRIPLGLLVTVGYQVIVVLGLEQAQDMCQGTDLLSGCIRPLAVDECCYVVKNIIYIYLNVWIYI